VLNPPRDEAKSSLVRVSSFSCCDDHCTRPSELIPSLLLLLIKTRLPPGLRQQSVNISPE